MNTLRTIRSGGQNGADTIAVEVARRAGLPTLVLLPRGGRRRLAGYPFRPGGDPDTVPDPAMGPRDGAASGDFCARHAALVAPGAVRSAGADYLERTFANVDAADATLCFGPRFDRGTRRTIEYAARRGRPCLIAADPAAVPDDLRAAAVTVSADHEALITALTAAVPPGGVLNVAGNSAERVASRADRAAMVALMEALCAVWLR